MKREGDAATEAQEFGLFESRRSHALRAVDEHFGRIPSDFGLVICGY
ncbi:MAG: hypothetical protein ACT4OI_06420 [Methanobacteriota archaeon]